MKLVVIDGPASLAWKREWAEFSGVTVLSETSCRLRDLDPQLVLDALEDSGVKAVVLIPTEPLEDDDRAELIDTWRDNVKFQWLEPQIEEEDA